MGLGEGVARRAPAAGDGKTLQLLRALEDIRGADGLVGLLGSLLGAEPVGLLRQVLLPEGPADELPHRLQGLVGNPEGIGPHVSDQRHRISAQVDPFIHVLGQPHGPLGAEPELRAGRLLESAGDERGWRRQGLGLLLHPGDPGGGVPDPLGDLQGPLFVPDLLLLAVHLEQAGLETLPPRGLQVGQDLPELLGDEGLDLPLPLHDQPGRHGLDPPCREPAGDLFPKQGRKEIAHQPVQDPPGLLGVHQLLVEFPRLLEGFLHGPLGDLVEGDPLDLALRELQGLGQVPGDGLSLPVGVGGEEDGLGLLGRSREFLHDLPLVRDHLVAGLEPVFHVDAQPGFWEIPNVAHGGLYGESPAQVLVDGFGLGRGLDDHQRFAHALLPEIGGGGS